MSKLRGIIINKGAVGTNVENLDGCTGLLINAPAISAVADGITGVVVGNVYMIKSVKEAEDMGIDAAYDDANSVCAYRHISEFYRMAGEGTKLYFMFCTTTKDLDGIITDHGKALINGADGEIRYLMVGYNPVTGYTPTYVNGLETTVSDAIPAAQTLADYCWENDKPIHVIIEGRGINGTAASMQDLRAIEIATNVIEYSNVSVVVGQDYDYYHTLSGVHQKGADIGTFTGTKASIAVNEHPGMVETLDISNAKKTIWVTGGLSNHTKISAATDDLQTLNDKGYIFAISYIGVSGFYWNDDHVCAPIIVDADGNMNVHTIGLSATLNKLSRLIRQYLLPKVKMTVPVDTATGKLPTGIVKYFEGIGNQAFTEMLANGEISGGEISVDPSSDLLTGNKELVTPFNMVPTGIVGQISATINIKKSL